MKFKLFVLAILFVTVSLLIVPDLIHMPVSGQADKSFKGTVAPFVPPSSSERLGSLPGNNFEFDDDEEEVEGDQEEEEIDRDKLPVLTKQERDEFLSDDNIDAIEPDRLTALSQEEETIDDDIDPISSIVEEIAKNESIIGDEESVPSPESSIIKFKDQNLEQILAAQEVAPEPDNQTISSTKEGQLPLNVTEDDFEKEQADKISESESPDVDVQSFINETANKVPTAPTTDNETAVTTEDTVEGKPSELLEMDPETGDEIQDIKGEQQTEQAQQVEETDESQTPQVEETDESQTPQVEESPNTEPIAQDGSVTTSQNQQLNIKLNANDADGDNLLFTIVDDPSNGELGNVKPSTNTVTYTPDEDYSGEDNFTFIVNDGTSDSKEATVSITVEEQQQTTEQAQQEEETDESQTPQEEEEDS